MSVSEKAEATTLGRKTPTAEMPRRAVVYRWAVGLSAIITLAVFFWSRPPLNLAYLGLFLVAGVLGDAFFRIRAAPGAYYSFSSTFTIVYFLFGGALAAALLEALMRIAGWIVSRFRKNTTQTPLYGLYNMGVYVLAAFAGALAVELIFRRPLPLGPVYDPESHRSIIVFALAYLGALIGISTGGVWARAGVAELRTRAWRRIVLWAAISVASSVAFAIILWELVKEMPLTAAFLFVTLLMAGIATMLRLNVELRSGNDELRAINRIGQLLSSTLDVGQIFRMLARETRTVLPWDGFFIARVMPDDDKVQINFMTGEGAEIATRTIPRGAGLTGRAIETGEAVLYERSEGETPLSPDDTLRGRRRPRSLIVAPMIFGEQTLGALSVQSFQADVYGESQKELLKTIAAQAAIALRNAELLQSEQKAIAERDEFLSLTTHEIKNPLTSIRGYLELAEDALQSSSIEEARSSLEVVKSEASKIQRFAEDLLEVSRMGVGKFTIKFEETDLSAIVSQVVQRYADTSEQEIDLKLTKAPTLLGDPTRLGQAVENLVSNAVKYSPEKSRIEVALEAEDDEVVVRVRDHGRGIPPNKLPLIFERFYRVEESGGTVKGTGLGLFITREIVRAHGGNIRVDSREGEGTEFIIELPVAGRGNKEPQ